METSNLMKGLVGGLVFAVVGAFIFQMVTSFTGYYIGWMAILAGALGGLGFGLLAREEDGFALHIMGGALGYAAIMLGYLLIYMTPIRGYEFMYGSYTIVPAEVVGFGEFITLTIEDSVWNLLFIGLGVFVGSKMAYYIVMKRWK